LLSKFEPQLNFFRVVASSMGLKLIKKIMHQTNQLYTRN